MPTARPSSTSQAAARGGAGPGGSLSGSLVREGETHQPGVWHRVRDKRVLLVSGQNEMAVRSLTCSDRKRGGGTPAPNKTSGPYSADAMR